MEIVTIRGGNSKLCIALVLSLSPANLFEKAMKRAVFFLTIALLKPWPCSQRPAWLLQCDVGHAICSTAMGLPSQRGGMPRTKDPAEFGPKMVGYVVDQ